MPEKDITVIPKGLYCYDENGKCPYWSMRKNKPYQFNGYCSFIGKGDWQLNKEYAKTTIIKQSPDKKDIGKFFDEIYNDFPLSLLWDQCKECGINEGDDYE